MPRNRRAYGRWHTNIDRNFAGGAAERGPPFFLPPALQGKRAIRGYAHASERIEHGRVLGVRDNGGEVLERGKAEQALDLELSCICKKELVGRVVDDALLHGAAVDVVAGDCHEVQVDAACADERLREEQRLEHADGGVADEAVELDVEVAARAEGGDVLEVRELLQHLDHVGGDDDLFVAAGDEVREEGVRARDVEEDGVAVVNLEVRPLRDGQPAGILLAQRDGGRLGDGNLRGGTSGLRRRRLVPLANARGAAVHAVALAFLRKRLQVLADAVHSHAKARREVVDLNSTILVEKVKNLCATLASEQRTPASLGAL